MANTYNSTCSHQGNPHVLLVPFPSQGHIAPFMKLGHQLSTHGSKVTFLTTEFIHARIGMAALQKLGGEEQEHIRIVSVPDGLAPEDERKDETRLTESIFKIMPGHLEDLIKKANEQKNNEKFTCVIADPLFGWALGIAEKMGLRNAILFASAPGILAMILHIPDLIKDGIIDANDGTPNKNEKIQLSLNLPALDSADFTWTFPGNKLMQKSAFQYLLLVNQNLKLPNWVLCNWFHELDPLANDLLPNIVPIGPLLANGQPIGNFWPEDITCLSWLDRQSPGSVIYVAFGSSTRFSQTQFDELALGLELVGQPFLWVVRSDLINGVVAEYPNGFKKRVANLGMMVDWAPQEKVLAHPSIACFLTHCGWNSNLEGISMGVPMLCWPYFTDQFYNKSCVCNGWKVGLELKPNEYGIITQHELKRKVNNLLSNYGIKANALKLKELAHKSVSEGGSSSKNLADFLARLKL